MNDIVINKIQSMQRCILRAREEYEFAGGDLAANITHQDAAVLNITRACELTIDLANHLTKVRHLGIQPTVGRVSSCWRRPGSSHRISARACSRWWASGTSRSMTIANSTPES